MVNGYIFFTRSAARELLLYVAHLNSDSIFTLKCIVVTAIVMCIHVCLHIYSQSDNDDDYRYGDDDGGNVDNDDNDNDIYM